MKKVTEELIKSLLKMRISDSHKGDYGHALLICGSKGMAGAAVLACGGALKSGCGLVTVHLPAHERAAIYSNFPSAMVEGEEKSFFTQLPYNLSKYNAIGIGCGLGQNLLTVAAFEDLLKQVKIPLVIDADALNILSKNVDLQNFIPKNSILTPHIGEFKRLVGGWQNDEEKIEKARNFTYEKQVFLLLKGANTMIFSPKKEIFVNTTGNAGMAKGGSGDVLTGLITGLYARGYSPKEAAIIGAFFHGKAGDKATENFGFESYNSRDLIEFIRI